MPVLYTAGSLRAQLAAFEVRHGVSTVKVVAAYDADEEVDGLDRFGLVVWAHMACEAQRMEG